MAAITDVANGLKSLYTYINTGNKTIAKATLKSVTVRSMYICDENANTMDTIIMLIIFLPTSSPLSLLYFL